MFLVEGHIKTCPGTVLTDDVFTLSTILFSVLVFPSHDPFKDCVMEGSGRVYMFFQAYYPY